MIGLKKRFPMWALICAVITVCLSFETAQAMLEDSRLSYYCVLSTNQASYWPPAQPMPDDMLAKVSFVGYPYNSDCIGGPRIYPLDYFVTTFEGISAMTSVQVIYLVNERVMDITPLGDLQNLQEFYMLDSHLQSLGDISGAGNLADVYLDGCFISDLYDFAAPASLWRLSLRDNNISDISTLPEALADSSELSLLDLRDNPLNADAYSIYIPRLRALLPDLEILCDGLYLTGDANNDGRVNITDFLILKSNISTEFGVDEYTPPSAKWRQGDFNSDGDINMTDFLLLRSNYGATRTTPTP